MSATTVVKLTGEGKHHSESWRERERYPNTTDITWASAKGREVRIHLPPHEPNSLWTCGTRYVWKLTEESLRELCGPHVPDRVFLCEHAIELD